MCFESNTTVKNESSPMQEEAFRLRTGAYNQAFPGGTGYFTDPSNSPFRITPGMQAAIDNVSQVAGNLPSDPWQNPALQAYGPTAANQWQHVSSMPYAEQWGQVAGDYGNVAGSPIVGPQMNWGAVQGGVGFTPTAREYSAVPVGDMAGVDVARIDPTAAIQAAQRHLSTISSPEIRNALQASGLGRSGAEAEALAREGVRLELPIQQQILQSDAQANQLEATIQANQQQVRFLEQQKAHLQAQALSAQSYEQAQQIQAQLATVDQQIDAALAQAEFAGQTQQAIAQRQSQLGYGTSILGQAANLMGQQYAGQAQFGNQVLGNLTQMGLGLPALQNQAYQNALQGAQTQLQAASLPQQMAMQDYQNLMNYNLSLLGATPLPSMNWPGSTSQGASPGAMDYLGTAALIGSQFVR